MFKSIFDRKNKLILKGFQVEKPSIFIHWNISQKELILVFEKQGHELKQVTTGYFTTTCTSLGGLQHKLGFHFEPKNTDALNQLEFFGDSYLNYDESFKEFQRYFEEYFGPPTKSFQKNAEGFPAYEWIIDNKIIIRHYVFDRFGLEEHLYIERL